jgi:hypothetical protein
MYSPIFDDLLVSSICRPKCPTPKQFFDLYTFSDSNEIQKREKISLNMNI